MDIKFIRVPASDGRNIAVNVMLVEAIEDNGETIKISISGKWHELNMNLSQFIDKCNECNDEEE